jgi:hypothetical protein
VATFRVLLLEFVKAMEETALAMMVPFNALYCKESSV